MDNVVVIAGTASNGIAKNVARLIKSELIHIQSKILPDGESYIRIPEEVANKIVVIVQSLYPPQDKHIMELLLMMDAAKGYGAYKIVLVVPYLAYARQDMRFLPGEPVSIELLLRVLHREGAEMIITVDPHKPDSLVAFAGKYVIIKPTKLFADAIKENPNDIVVLAPDGKAIAAAQELSSILKTQYTFVEKERDRATGEIMLKSVRPFDFKNKKVIIIDDIISTGKTMAQAAKFAKENGAGDVIAAATHLITSGECCELMKASGISRIIGTNTIPNDKAELIDISGMIAESILKGL
jgi:ribose-phosphate pyrophosphokinase